MKKTIFIFLALFLISSIYFVSASNFVQVNGTDFYLNGKPFYFAGTNAYYLFYTNNNANCVDTGSHQGCLIPFLNSAKALNLTVIRTWGSSEGSGGQRFGYNFQPNAGVYNNTTFAHFDRVIKEASNRSLKLIVVLANNWDSFGGMCQYVKWCGLPNASLCAAGESYPFPYAYVHDSFYTSNCTKNLYKNYVNYMLNRTNSLTGIKYKDDPAIFAWELANEPRARSDNNCTIVDNWIGEMSAYIKSIDSNHLVTGGTDGGYKNKAPDSNNWWYQCKEGQDYIPNNNWSTIDFATFNYYDDPNRFDVNQQRWISDHITESHNILQRPVILKEFNTINVASRPQILAGFYSLMENLSINGDTIWMLSDFREADADGFEFLCPNDTGICTSVLNHANYMINKTKIIYPACNIADANGDGKVDGGDLAVWQQNYDPLGLNPNNTQTMGDFNGDKLIDGGDLAIWQQNYNPIGSGACIKAVNLNIGTLQLSVPSEPSILNETTIPQPQPNIANQTIISNLNQSIQTTINSPIVTLTPPSKKSCIDNDNEFKAGCVSVTDKKGKTKTYCDKCSSKKNLNEYSCSKDNQISKTIKCKNKCVNGACT